MGCLGVAPHDNFFRCHTPTRQFIVRSLGSWVPDARHRPEKCTQTMGPPNPLKEPSLLVANETLPFVTPTFIMADAAAIPKLDNTFGAIFIGVLLGTALWGISCMQTFEYFTDPRKDTWAMKGMVITLFSLDTLHQILVCHVIYTYLITEHFNVAYLNEVVWSLIAQVLVEAVIGLMVQTFFVYRIWILSRNNYIVAGVTTMLVLAEFSLSLTYFVKGVYIKSFLQLPTVLRISQSVNALAAASDIAIALVLIFILWNSKTGFSKSDSIINQLILYSLNTGFLTSICALFSLITITVYPSTFIFITFYITLGRLYTNSLLATLNARKKLMGRVGNTGAHSVGSHDATRNKAEGTFSASQNAHLAIRVDTETAKGYDSMYPGRRANGYEMSVFDGREQKDIELAV